MIAEFRDDYSWLSNFWPCSVVYENVVYPSIENAYQAAKFPAEQRHIFTYCSAWKSKKEGKKALLPANWHTKKILIMFDLLLQKYHTDPFSRWLLETGTQEIQEGNTWGDTFWGVDLKTGKGYNMLGIMIMCIRNELREQFHEGF